MYSKELLQPADLQPFINQPETLINQTLEFQLAVVNDLQTPVELLEILVNQSCYSQVVEAAKLHVKYVESTAGIEGNLREIAEERIKNAPLQQNDRLVAELLKIAPVPEYLISEWIPGHRLIEGLENPYLFKEDKIKLLERLGKSTIIEERLTAATHPDTPRKTLEILAGDVELPIRIAVKYRDDSPDDVIEIVESQYEVASNWETLALELTELARSKWSWVRQAVARNFNAPVEVLRELAGDGEEKVQLAIARNLAAPGEVLELLVNHSWGEVTKSIAKHPNAGDDTLRKLLPKHQYYIRERLKKTFNSTESNKLRPNLYYRALLDKQISEENQKARGFVGRNCNNIKQFKEYVLNNAHKQSRNYLAYKLDTPLRILEELVKDSDAKIRATLAENPNLPVHCLLDLAKDSDLSVRKKLLDFYSRRDKLPVEVIEILKNDESEEIRVLVASNKSTTSDILSYLSNDTSLKVKNKVASNPNTSSKTLESLWYKDNIFDEKNHNIPSHIVAEKIAITKDSRTLCKILERYLKTFPQVSAKTLEKLALYNNGEVRCRVAAHPNTPLVVLEALATEKLRLTHWNLASNSNTPPHVLKYLWNNWQYYDGKCDYELCHRIAGNINTPANLLEKFSKGNSYTICQAVSLHPNTPLSILKKFAQRDFLKNSTTGNSRGFNYFQSYEYFLHQLRYNPRLTPEILEILTNDISPEVRANLIGHENLTIQIQTKLANDESPQVRKVVAGYRESPIEIVELLIADESPDVRQALAKNSNVSSSILKTLALDISPIVRKNVAENPNTPTTVLEQLSLDADKRISQSLINNPNTPSNIKQTLQYRLRVNITPTLKGLTRLYNSETDDLPTLLSEYVQSQTPFVRFISLMHPFIPTEFIEQYSQSLLWWERYAVAINSATSFKIREKLTKDCNFIVKAAAKESL